MTAAQKRQVVADKYKLILGRNIYSQDANKRECAFVKYKDGKHYSDCSSSVRLAYREAAIGLPNIGGNTVGIYQNKALKTVSCAIKSGVPTNIAALRVGDMLLFAGGDESRAYAGYVGHVEMIYKISGSKVTLCGHGSSTPSTKDLVACCKGRQAAKANTKRGNKGLIKVVRAIPDDAATSAPIVPADPMQPPKVDTSTTLSAGGTYKVNTAAANIRKLPSPSGEIVTSVKSGTKLTLLDDQSWVAVIHNGCVGWISPKYAVRVGQCVAISGGDANIRAAPVDGKVLGVAKACSTFSAPDLVRWAPIIYDKCIRYISRQYLTKV